MARGLLCNMLSLIALYKREVPNITENNVHKLNSDIGDAVALIFAKETCVRRYVTTGTLFFLFLLIFTAV